MERPWLRRSVRLRAALLTSHRGNAALFAALDSEFGPFTLDVCATAENAKCAHYFDRAADGLARRWTGRVWCNPPYGREIGRWTCKAAEAVRSGDAELVVCLVPARVDRPGGTRRRGRLPRCDSCAAGSGSAPPNRGRRSRPP